MSGWERMTKAQLIDELEARGVWLERLGAIVDGSRDAVFISDEDSQFMLVNSAACELTGYPEEELLEMRIPDLHKEEDLHAYNTHHDSIMEGNEALTEADILQKDGTKVATEFSNRRIVIAGVPYMHTIARDITERKRTEEALRLMGTISLQVSDSVIATDLDFKLIFINEAFQNLYGYSREEILGRTADFLNAEPMAQEIQQDIYEAVSAGRPWRGELLNRRKDGSTFTCELTVSPLADEGGNIFGYAGTQRDISERKRKDEEREALISQLGEALQRVETLRGILPICSNCGEFRDDKNFWKQLEDFVGNHAESESNHKLCVECAEEASPGAVAD